MSPPRQPTRVLTGLLLLLPLAALLGTATAGGIYVGRIRYFPEGYTLPEVTTDALGRTTYKPSIPTGFKEFSSGIGVQVDDATVHPNLDRPPQASPTAKDVYYLNFPDGRRVAVQPGSVVQVNGESFIVVGMIQGDFYLRSLLTREYLKLSREAPQLTSPAPGAAAVN